MLNLVTPTPILMIGYRIVLWIDGLKVVHALGFPFKIRIWMAIRNCIP